jgi:hypothetical protein
MTRKVGPAERDAVQARILKAFLMTAEARGWVNGHGAIKLRFRMQAWAYWTGVRAALELSLMPAAGFDDAFYARIKWHDPVRVARDLHGELCLALRTGGAA